MRGASLDIFPSTESRAVELAAKRLHAKMEHLDPCGDEWEQLSDSDREFYRLCVRDLVDSPAMMWLALHRAAD